MPLLDERGARVCWLTAAQARRMLAGGEADPLATKRRVRALRAAGGAGERVIGGRYSHQRETAENPAGVWTLVRIKTHMRPAYEAVLLGCERKCA